MFLIQIYLVGLQITGFYKIMEKEYMNYQDMHTPLNKDRIHKRVTSQESTAEVFASLLQNVLSLDIEKLFLPLFLEEHC